MQQSPTWIWHEKWDCSIHQLRIMWQQPPTISYFFMCFLAHKFSPFFKWQQTPTSILCETREGSSHSLRNICSIHHPSMNSVFLIIRIWTKLTFLASNIILCIISWLSAEGGDSRIIRCYSQVPIRRAVHIKRAG